MAILFVFAKHADTCMAGKRFAFAMEHFSVIDIA